MESFKTNDGNTIVIHAKGYGNSAAEAEEDAYQKACLIERHQHVDFIVDAINGANGFFRSTKPCKKEGKETGRWKCIFCENKGKVDLVKNHPILKAE